MKPLSEGEGKFLAQNEIRKIFGNLIEINETHMAFYNELERTVSRKKPIAQLFLHYVRTKKNLFLAINIFLNRKMNLKQIIVNL